MDFKVTLCKFVDELFYFAYWFTGK